MRQPLQTAYFPIFYLWCSSRLLVPVWRVKHIKVTSKIKKEGKEGGHEKNSAAETSKNRGLNDKEQKFKRGGNNCCSITCLNRNLPVRYY